MSKHGILYPEIIDFVAADEEECVLVVVQDEYLSKEDAFALQEKLNNYLCYGIDGRLFRDYPDCIGKRLVLQINLFQIPDPFVFEFLEKAKSSIEQEGAHLRIKMMEN
jgi:Family of unknown function (DUF6572)